MKDNFDGFADKIIALGQAMNMKGGRETVKFMLDRKGATRGEIVDHVGISRSDLHRIVAALKSGDLLDVPEGYGAIMHLSPNIGPMIAISAKPVANEGVTILKQGGMTAKFTKLPTKEDPIVEGTCGNYSFTAIINEDTSKGIWGVGAEHFVMRDRISQLTVASHDPDLGWTKRPNSPKKITHFSLIERLFKAAPKKF